MREIIVSTYVPGGYSDSGWDDVKIFSDGSIEDTQVVTMCLGDGVTRWHIKSITEVVEIHGKFCMAVVQGRADTVYQFRKEGVKI